MSIHHNFLKAAVLAAAPVWLCSSADLAGGDEAVVGKAAQADPRVVAATRAKAALPKLEDWQLGPFVKHPEPVLRPTRDSVFKCPILDREVRWEEQNVYNPAAVVRNGKVHLLYRADDRNPALGWGRTCRIGLATGADGIHFTPHPEPVLYPDNDEFKQYEWEGAVRTCTSSRTKTVSIT